MLRLAQPRAKRPLRLRRLLEKVDLYRELFEAFPEAQIQVTRPTAIMGEQEGAEAT